MRPDGGVLAARELKSAGRRHAQSLVAEIDALLRENSARAADCDVVAVSVGPGSFTGLRCGVVCAKTFAYATGCRLTAVDTFEAVATASPDEVEAVSVIADAQRGDIYIGRYERDSSGAMRRVGSITIENAEAWFRGRSSGEAVSGPDLGRFDALLPEFCRRLPPESRIPRAETVARLGERQAAAGRVADPWTLEPVYLRKSAAEEKWDSARLGSELGNFDGGGFKG